MSSVTLNIPDNLMHGIGPLRDRLPRIIALGLRELTAEDSTGFSGLADVLEYLAALPEPEDILALRPSEGLQERIESLLQKNRQEGLTPDEELQWRQYQYIEHLVRKAKISALNKLKAS